MTTSCPPRRPVTLGLALAATAMLSGTALAAPTLSMMWDASGDSAGPSDFDLVNFGGIKNLPDGSQRLTGGLLGETWSLNWVGTARESLRDQDMSVGSYVDAALVVTNTSKSTQTFSLLMSLDLAGSFIGPASYSGSVGYTLTNNGFDGGATIAAPAGSALYQSFVDGADPKTDPGLATLLDDPFTDSVTAPFGSTASGDSFVDLAGSAPSESIAMLLTFTLSPGDSASVSGVLTVIPGPGAVILLGVAGLTGTRRRRRH